MATGAARVRLLDVDPELGALADAGRDRVRASALRGAGAGGCAWRVAAARLRPPLRAPRLSAARRPARPRRARRRRDVHRTAGPRRARAALDAAAGGPARPPDGDLDGAGAVARGRARAGVHGDDRPLPCAAQRAAGPGDAALRLAVDPACAVSDQPCRRTADRALLASGRALGARRPRRCAPAAAAQPRHARPPRRGQAADGDAGPVAPGRRRAAQPARHRAMGPARQRRPGAGRADGARGRAVTGTAASRPARCAARCPGCKATRWLESWPGRSSVAAAMCLAIPGRSSRSSTRATASRRSTSPACGATSTSGCSTPTARPSRPATGC